MTTIQTIHQYRCDLSKGPSEVTLKTPIMHQDALGDVFRVAVWRGNNVVDLTGMTVRGFLYFASTRQTLLLEGSITDGCACVTLTSECYAIPGYASLVVQVQDGDIRHSLLKVNMCITRTGSEIVIDPGDILPTLPELLGQIAAMEQATAEAREAAAAADAAREGIQGDLAALTEDIADLNSNGNFVDNIVNAENAKINRYKFIKGTTGAVIDTDGYEYGVSDKINAVGGKEYAILASAIYKNALYCFYDSSDNALLVERSNQEKTTISKKVIAPVGASYVLVSAYDNNDSYACEVDGKVSVAQKIGSIVNEKKLCGALAGTFAKGEYEALETPYSENGYAIFSTGFIADDDNFQRTDYIDVENISSIKVTGGYYYSVACIVFYDDKKKMITSYPSESTVGTYTDYEIEVPHHAKWMIVNGVKSNGEKYSTVVKKLKNLSVVSPYKKWVNKKWVTVGDSLTEKNTRATKHYHDYVSEETGIEVVNMGVSGTGYYARKSENLAFYQRITNVPTDADVVTIFGSGNDCSSGRLGSVTDTGTDTWCGCINTTIDTLIAMMPTVQLGIVTPTPWDNSNPANDSDMKSYSKAIVEICQMRSIPCLDLFHCSNLRPWTEEGRNACYTRDNGNGCHPDETGHALIAPRFKSFLETLIM